MAASTNLTPEQRSQRARLAALTRWSKEDPRENVTRASAGFLAKFLREVDEAAAASGEVLTENERRRRAEAARRAYMTRLAFASSKARARKAG